MNVFVIEDSAVYRHLLRCCLTEWNGRVSVFPDAESAFPLLESATEPILLIVDWELPGMSGLELLSKVRSCPLKHYIYVLVITARTDTADLVAALDAGADDYISKPFKNQEFRARVRVAERALNVHEELITANERLELLAHQDPLSELLNRRAFLSGFQREFLAAKRKKSSLTLVMCDIDHFKQINDRFGHAIGDEVIQLISRALQSSCRGSDIAARLGGDEFVLLLPDSQIPGVEALVRRVRERILKRDTLKEIDISVSFGISAVNLDHTLKTAMEQADAALYESKRHGRDRYSVAHTQTAHM